MAREDPKTNDFLISIHLGDLRKTDALILAERIASIIEREVEHHRIGTYGMSVNHNKAYFFQNR